MTPVRRRPSRPSRALSPFLFLVAMPGAPSNILAPSSKARSPYSSNFLSFNRFESKTSKRGPRAFRPLPLTNIHQTEWSGCFDGQTNQHNVGRQQMQETLEPLSGTFPQAMPQILGLRQPHWTSQLVGESNSGCFMTSLQHPSKSGYAADH